MCLILIGVPTCLPAEPGTSNDSSSIQQGAALGDGGSGGAAAVIVTTPQDVAIIDVRKEVSSWGPRGGEAGGCKGPQGRRRMGVGVGGLDARCVLHVRWGSIHLSNCQSPTAKSNANVPCTPGPTSAPPLPLGIGQLLSQSGTAGAGCGGEHGGPGAASGAGGIQRRAQQAGAWRVRGTACVHKRVPPPSGRTFGCTCGGGALG